MQLHAQLESTTLGDLLGQLHRARASGVLVLQANAERLCEIHWREGAIEHVGGSLGGARLGDVLRRLGRLDARARARLESCCFASSGRLLGERLVQAGVVSAGLLQRALRVQARARLEKAFALRRGRVWFRVARVPSPAWSGQLSPKPLLLGRPRARPPGPAAQRAGAAPPQTWRRDALSLLGLRPGASWSEVQGAFRRAARRAHPDRGGALAEFQALSCAYHRLKASL